MTLMKKRLIFMKKYNLPTNEKTDYHNFTDRNS